MAMREHRYQRYGEWWPFEWPPDCPLCDQPIEDGMAIYEEDGWMVHADCELPWVP